MVQKKNKFFSAYDRPCSRCSACGSPEAPVFADSVDDNGVACVIVTGKSNVDDFIQSFKDDTDIYKILDRLSLTGGELPSVPLEQFADISQVPSNIHEAYKQVENAKLIYNNLAKDKKVEYPTFNDFISDFGSAKFFSIFKSDVSNKNFNENVNNDNANESVGDISDK